MIPLLVYTQFTSFRDVPSLTDPHNPWRVLIAYVNIAIRDTYMEDRPPRRGQYSIKQKPKFDMQYAQNQLFQDIKI